MINFSVRQPVNLAERSFLFSWAILLANLSTNGGIRVSNPLMLLDRKNVKATKRMRPTKIGKFEGSILDAVGMKNKTPKSQMSIAVERLINISGR